MLEQAMAALNMPTRREVDTTHRRVHHLQRQLHALTARLEAVENGANAEPKRANGVKKVTKKPVVEPDGGQGHV